MKTTISTAAFLVATTFAQIPHAQLPAGWPSNWEVYNQDYDSSYSWHDFRAICNELGGHLVSVGDSSENDLLVELLRGFTGNATTTSTGLFLGGSTDIEPVCDLMCCSPLWGTTVSVTGRRYYPYAAIVLQRSISPRGVTRRLE